MKIAIMGASGTGKTTLATAIASAYGIPLNPIGARSVALDMGFTNPYDVDAAGRRKEFQERLFDEKLIWEHHHDRFVTDRSYLDNLTYCALHMPGELPDDAVENYGAAMSCYDVVFCLWRADFQSLGDSVRQVSKTYHDIYERLLVSFASSSSIQEKLCPLGAPAGRAPEALARLARSFPDATRVS